MKEVGWRGLSVSLSTPTVPEEGQYCGGESVNTAFKRHKKMKQRQSMGTLIRIDESPALIAPTRKEVIFFYPSHPLRFSLICRAEIKPRWAAGQIREDYRAGSWFVSSSPQIPCMCFCPAHTLPGFHLSQPIFPQATDCTGSGPRSAEKL